MSISESGVALIKKHEKCRLEAYLPTKNDKPTIGWGHCGPDVQLGVTITQAQADALLETDLLWADTAVSRTCPEATQGQHDALVSLCFNIGQTAFTTKCRVPKLHNAKEYGKAGQAFALWNEQKGVILQELVHRRAEEAAMYLADSPLPKADAIDVGGKADGEKPLSHSRVMNGQAITGAGVGLAGASHTIQSNSDTLQQITDVFTNLGPVFQWAMLAGAGLTLLGIGMTLYGRYKDRSEGRS